MLSLVCIRTNLIFSHEKCFPLYISQQIFYIYIYICVCVWGAKTQIFMLGPKPHLLIRMRPRSRKCLERPHSIWSCREMFKGTSPRGLSSSDLMNVSQVNFGLTWVTFQEGPTTKIDFKCARKG